MQVLCTVFDIDGRRYLEAFQATESERRIASNSASIRLWVGVSGTSLNGAVTGAPSPFFVGSLSLLASVLQLRVKRKWLCEQTTKPKPPKNSPPKIES